MMGRRAITYNAPSTFALESEICAVREGGVLICVNAMTVISDLIETFLTRGDLAHLALFLWASVASLAALFALRELAGASRRFDEFVRQLTLFNRRVSRRRRAAGNDESDDDR
jgi:hypothetical protein